MNDFKEEQKEEMMNNCVDKQRVNAKKEYLIKTLSRTKRKDYENYVIGAIWHRLNNLEIKPVSQQYVKRSDGKYALLDLYFPQLNVGIECDEAYHEKNKEPDKIREVNLEQALSALQTGKEFTLIRINANTDVVEFEKQINNAVEIKKICMKNMDFQDGVMKKVRFKKF